MDASLRQKDAQVRKILLNLLESQSASTLPGYLGQPCSDGTLIIMQLLYGLHPVEEAIRSGSRRLESVLIARREDARLRAILDACRTANIPVRQESKDHLTRLAKTASHQGVIAVVAEHDYLSVEDLMRPRGEHLFLLALDGVEDPHNLGALLRTADGAGVDGIILPERRAAPVNATVVKTSAGATEHVRIARVTNLVRALEDLKRQNAWCVGLDERGTENYADFDFRCNCVVVLGGEGGGLHDLVRRTCDHLLRIPMAGQIASLNVSVAGAVVLYEAARQRRAGGIVAATEKPKRPAKGLGS